MEEIKLLMLYIRFQNFCTETVSNFRLCSPTIPYSFCARTTTGYRIGLLFTHMNDDLGAIFFFLLFLFSLLYF